MKSFKLLTAFVLLVSLLSSCRKNEWRIVKGKGETINETRNIQQISRIHLSVNATVDFVQDSVYSLEVSAQKNILEVLTTEREGETLKIGFNANVLRHDPIRIKIHSPLVRELRISGSGDINASKLVTTNLELCISGSGNISVSELKSDALSTVISGSGNINVYAGSCASVQSNISGSGNTNLIDMQAQSVNAKISGSGDLKVHCTESLVASISGSGNITYKGQASVNSSVSGSGKLIHLN